MTQKIFWIDPYLTELTTKIKTVNENKITVYETIFYAESGGQESDSGTIGDYKIEKAEKNGKEIVYTVQHPHTLHVDEIVTIQIEWPRRYQLMKLHFAAEIVLELIYKSFPGIQKIGAHISQDKARIDFQSSESLSPHIDSLTNAAQSIIDNGLEVISAFSDAENERRYWQIDGFNPVPCGGTHIKNTQEIGKIRLKRINLGKDKERVEIYC